MKTWDRSATDAETYRIFANEASGEEFLITSTKSWPLAQEIATNANFDAANSRAYRSDPNILRAHDATSVEIRNSANETLALYVTAALVRQFVREITARGF